jgi:2-oxoglutarate ferredoxin oxidoreductase subunit alpha
MVPVMLLTDGYIANGSEPWLIPDFNKLPKIEVKHPGPPKDGEAFMPYARDENLSRPWALPGTPGLMHRIGGLEKQDITGNVSYDPINHEHMVRLRQQKVDNVAKHIPPQEVVGPPRGKLLVVSWGGTYGACLTAVRQVQGRGGSVAHAHLRYLNPLPANLGEILEEYDQIMVPELNLGQLNMLLRARFLIDTIGYNKIQGRPFSVAELTARIEELLAT